MLKSLALLTSDQHPVHLTRVWRTVLKTGLTPSASGSAYYEVETSRNSHPHGLSLQRSSSTIKLACTVHGPKPLPRSAPFTPHALLSTHVKFAPFAARERRGYLRDSSERDLSAHLETILGGAIIGDRWPKSGIEIVITILEGDQEATCNEASAAATTKSGRFGDLGMMNILAGCINVASAAIADAGIDAVDLVAGGVSAIVDPSHQEGYLGRHHTMRREEDGLGGATIVRDPSPIEHEGLLAACVVGYLSERDKLTGLWLTHGFLDSRSGAPISALLHESLVDEAAASASEARLVLEAALKDSLERQHLESGPATI